MDATDALNEIAFRLERDRAPQFKVQAFRRAADTVGVWSPAELRVRAGDGRLKATKGIGASTLEVIRQSLDGDVPDRLQKLRDAQTSPLSDAGRALAELVRGDLHSHSDWSDGTTRIPLMVDAAVSLGREYLALTDHSPHLTVAHGLTAERLTEQLDVVAGLDEATDGLRLLSGIEVDILDDGALDQTPELLDRLDVVVASIHSHLRADRRTMTERMLGAITDRHTSILGHCTGRLVEGSRGTRPPSEFDAERVFAACAENGVAVEINARPERQDPPDELIAVALAAGCFFSIDSDAHAPGQLGLLDYGIERAAQNQVPAERIITTWPVEQLLEWVRSNR
ncbi:PHP domain-containing protein [Subtercola boreus]|uniref:PHP domain-containing protein n=1 Tax=Subtercola boreus TaxID=120213 RepID=A0A3E0WBE1_9MICO|nr:PHP domain-containing protein [Subtercola boreus]RFA19833.1 PHP domain-containing protein [Subtercola boreus]RFA19900.1 PHP domain-containing protein [Subtercola boreus]RFA26293.1 PHP domain-containing protein [Subtercola boreus]